MTAGSQVDPVLIFDIVIGSIDPAGHARLKFDTVDQGMATRFQGNGPGMGLYDAEIFYAQMIHICHQNADIAPVTMLRFTRFSRIGTVTVPMQIFKTGRFGAGEIFRTRTAEDLTPVAGRTRMIGSFQHGIADTADMDVGKRFNFRNAQTAVRAPEEIVPAAVREFDPAIFQDHRRAARKQYGTVQKPPVPLRFHIRNSAADDDYIVAAVTDRSFDPFIVGLTGIIIDIFHPHFLLNEKYQLNCGRSASA